MDADRVASVIFLALSFTPVLVLLSLPLPVFLSTFPFSLNNSTLFLITQHAKRRHKNGRLLRRKNVPGNKIKFKKRLLLSHIYMYKITKLQINYCCILFSKQ
jgi:hypothetical protein